jgi:hypothetical protein
MTRPDTIADNARRAQAAYVAGEIEVDELERALEHIYAGGMGTAEFPYLPAYEAFELEWVRE